jgi:hypothetical protein
VADLLKTDLKTLLYYAESGESATRRTILRVSFSSARSHAPITKGWTVAAACQIGLPV